MSRSLCAISGISFTTEHMPSSLKLTARETSHPLFSANYSQLCAVANQWVDGELDTTQSYLLYLALFNITDMIQFRTPAERNANTDMIVAANMPALLKVVDTIIHVGTGRCKSQLLLPTFVINSETKDLTSSKDWIELWNLAHNDYLDGYKTSIHLQKIADRESRLEALIKDKSKDISSYAVQIASWAYDVAGFARYQTVVFGMRDKNGAPLKIGDYWKQLIIDCAKRSDIYNIHDADLEELIEELEDNIDVASSGIFGHTLLSLLNSVRKSKEEFFKLGDIDVSDRGTIYKILDPEESVEDANKVVLINSASIVQPKESDYPNKLAYLKARTKWDMAQRHAASDKLRQEQAAAIQQETTNAVISYKGTEL